MTQIKGIMIDYGGTIDTGGRHWFQVFRSIYTMYNMVADDALLRAAYVYAEQQLERDAALIKPDETFHDLLWRKVDYQFAYFMQHGHAIDEACKWQVVNAAYEMAQAVTEGSAYVLRTLAKQYPLVLVSNFYGNLPAVINDFGMTDCFRTIIESAAVGIRKPNPEIFRLGIQHLGLQPAEVVVVGDSYTNDIAPAQSLGCKTVWLKGRGWNEEEENHPERQADVVIGHLPELLEIFNHKS